MAFTKDYVEYLKDIPEGKWFKAKLYGWGWTPVTWEGWAVTLGFMALVFGNAYRLDHQLSIGNTKEFILETILLIALLIYICYRKGEKPRWRWGVKQTDKNHVDQSDPTI